MSDEQMIGIVGGVGPYAGLDLAEKIFDETVANTDQEHLPVALISVPGTIAEVLRLETVGAGVVGIPCNTAHAPQIFDIMTAELDKSGSTARLLHMIEEIAGFIRRRFPKIETVGVLSTTGTQIAGVYPHYLEREGLRVLQPDGKLQSEIHAAIYDPESGIKARSNPVTDKARDRLLGGILYLEREGAEAIILGCSEIPLAVTDKMVGGVPMIDPTFVLARALIKSVAPDRLRTYEQPGEDHIPSP
jgi:aspartate racemase